MANKPNPTVEQLRQLLRYDPATGNLFWVRRGPQWFADGCRSAQRRSSQWDAKWAGRLALHCICGDYRKGAVLEKQLMAHRVASAIANGIELRDLREIDHINGVKTDNRLINLRHVTHGENAKNVAVYRSNTSGFHGVMWEKSHKAWAAKININGRQCRIGRFKKFDDAVAARKAAEVRYGYHENHGRPGRK
ncbi:HNH endonuclease [Sphingomonas japonica]|uniref:HNH nuclease domain-containing protein n=1 Tax=Sphingomonas japonica TaxID=511662 RepID=A0ABX0U618_9SPHN|nr:HNH endonuclease [Sphingomonas japonica]NIJ24836.1 hypothetical protein [Sphingomonas japonica]